MDRSRHRCILLLVDGLRPDIGETQLDTGNLPNLAEMLRRGGRGRAITVFPSTTTVAYLPFLTGCTPGRCDIPSIRWLDRTRYAGRWWRDRAALRSYCGYQAGLVDNDIAPDVRTIFNLVPESLGIFTPVARGLTRERQASQRERLLWGALGHYALWHQPSDDIVARRVLEAADGPWRFVFAQFPAVDGYTHQSGHDSPPVHRALERVDAMVGQLCERLRARSELDHTLIMVVSDHGAARVHTHLDLADWFRARDVPTLSHPNLWTRRPQAAVMVAGNGSAMVYAKPEEPRERRWPIERLRQPSAFGVRRDLVAELVREPAVGLVAAEMDEGSVWVEGAKGAARIWNAGPDIGYEPLTGDPLGVGGRWVASPREWLAATFDDVFPDAAFQLLDQFRASRTGDLVVVAREGYDFRGWLEIPEHQWGHGSLAHSHMHTPVWSSHPLPAVPLRTIDLFPALLGWLGVPVPPNIDGEPVWRPTVPRGRTAATASDARPDY